MANVFRNPSNPFVHKMGPLRPGKIISISGIPHLNPRRINVNIESTPNGPDIAFHCSFRFNYGGNRNVVVHNTKQNNAWGAEERIVSFFPLTPDAFFEMTVLVEQSCFKVTVDDNCVLKYQHRLQPLDKFTFLRIEGDIRITQVHFL